MVCIMPIIKSQSVRYAYHWRVDDALLSAQRLGKSSALCAPGSDFQVKYSACVSCTQEHSGALASNTSYLAPDFAQFLDYCDIKAVLVTITLSAPVANTVLYETKTTIISIPGGFTANATAQTSSLTNVRTTTGSTLTAIVSGSSIGSDRPTSSPDSGGRNQSQEWISGPVVGSVAGVALILTATMLLLRRKRKTRHSQDAGNDTGDKPQLYSEFIPKPELENSEKKAPIKVSETNLAETARGPHELLDPRNPVESEAPTRTVEASSGEHDTTLMPQGSV